MAADNDPPATPKTDEQGKNRIQYMGECMISGQYLIETTQRPFCFEHHHDGHRWLLIMNDDPELIGYGAFYVDQGDCTMHVIMVKWGASIYRVLTKAFYREFLPAVQKCGAKRLIVVKEGSIDPKWEKFITMFGFKKPKTVLVSERNI